jgi:hypothetical protein
MESCVAARRLHCKVVSFFMLTVHSPTALKIAPWRCTPPFFSRHRRRHYCTHRTTYYEEHVTACASRIFSHLERLSASALLNTTLASTILRQFTAGCASMQYEISCLSERTVYTCSAMISSVIYWS